MLLFCLAALSVALAASSVVAQADTGGPGVTVPVAVAGLGR